MIVTRVQEQDNNANGYLVFQVVSRLNWFIKWCSQVVCRSTYKWYLTSGTHEDSKFKNWSKLTNPTSGSMVSNSFKWYHISTRGINHTRWWFHKWSWTLSDHQMKNASLTTRAQVYQMDDPCNDLGGGVPPIGIKVKDSMCGISRAIQVVSFQHIW